MSTFNWKEIAMINFNRYILLKKAANVTAVKWKKKEEEKKWNGLWLELLNETILKLYICIFYFKQLEMAQ